MIHQMVARAVAWLVGQACRRPWLTVALGVALAGASAGYAATSLGVETGKLHLLPGGHRDVVRFQAYARDFGALDDLVVVVRAPRVGDAGAFAERLVARLRAGPAHYRAIAYRVDPRGFEGRALLYLSREQLQRIHARLAESHDVLSSFLRHPTVDELLAGINRQIGAALVGQAFDVGLTDAPQASDLAPLRDLLRQIGERLDGDAPYRSPWDGLLGAGEDTSAQGSFFLSDDGSLLFILLTPAVDADGFAPMQELLVGLRAHIAAVRREFPAVEAGVTGAPALYNDELTVAFADSSKATLLAMGLTLVVVLIAFRRPTQPILMVVTLGMSLAWALGAATALVGYLTMFSVMFLSIVIGIGIDYGIYVLFRYDEERVRGRGVAEALAVTAARNGPAVVVSAACAAATFFVLGATDFRSIREFGVISGTAILLAALAMLTVFPALVVLSERWRPRTPATAAPREIVALERLARRPVRVLLPAAVLAGVALAAAPGLQIDYNVLKLQARGTESVTWERIILATARQSGFPALATAGSVEELTDKQARLRRLSSVSDVKSVLQLIPEHQTEKIALIGRLRALVGEAEVGRPQPLDWPRLAAELTTLRRRLDLAPGGPVPEALRAAAVATRDEAAAVLDRLRRADRARATTALERFQGELARDLDGRLALLRANLRPSPITPERLPEELRRRFVGRSGRLLLEVHPSIDIWTRAGAERFIADVRSVDPDATGHPVIAFESIKLMETAYRQGSLYALILVAALALLLLRRAADTWLALVPLLLGILWGLGLMRACGLSFNLANVWGIPLVIGAAAEFGLNIVARAREALEQGGPSLPRSTALSVFFNGLTTIGGFGSLLVAHHQGIWSLGVLLVLGTVTSLVASLIVLPALLQVSRPR